MLQMLLSVHLFGALLTFAILIVAQAGPDLSRKYLSKRNIPYENLHVARTNIGSMYLHTCILHPLDSLHLVVMMLSLTETSVGWTNWTSHDGIQDGKDSDGIPYIKLLIDSYAALFPDPDDRIGVFGPVVVPQ